MNLLWPFVTIYIVHIATSIADSVPSISASGTDCIITISNSVSRLRQLPASQLRQAFQHVAAAQKHGRPLIYRGILDKTVHHILVAVARCGKKHPEVPCLQDPTMPAVAAGLRVFFASDLRDNALLMPHYITQMLFTVTSLRAGSVFVSIYESGSKDSTGAWLHLFETLLTILEVPHHIETGGTERPNGKDRIHHLAHMRNLATGKMRQGINGELPEWHADRLVFINDVYFCARDAVRLLQHVSADLACSMDFLQWKDPPSTVDVYPYGVDGPPLSVVTDPTQLQFYDVWVARDVEGSLFSNTQPYVHHGYSLDRLRRGLPFPVSCCWNGMLSINAEPFRLGYKFRAGSEGDCRESETSVMCKDFLRMGYSNFIVDPGVRLAYEPADARQLYTSKVDVPVTPWAEVAAAPAIDPDFAPRKFRMTCCDKADDGSDDVDFFKCHALPEIFSRAPSAAVAA